MQKPRFFLKGKLRNFDVIIERLDQGRKGKRQNVCRSNPPLNKIVYRLIASVLIGNCRKGFKTSFGRKKANVTTVSPTNTYISYVYMDRTRRVISL